MKHNDYGLKDTLESPVYPNSFPVSVTPDLVIEVSKWRIRQ
jgi:hypothetical protein